MRAILVVATLVMMTGCSAKYWAGEDAGVTPGIHVRGPTLFTPAEASVTSNGAFGAKSIKYQGGTDSQPAEFVLEDLTVNQDVSGVIREQPAKIKAVGEAQYSQVAYVKEVLSGVRGIVGEIVPVLNLLAAARIQTSASETTLTLPGGFSIGGKTTTNAQDISDYLKSLAGAASAVVETTATTTQPGP